MSITVRIKNVYGNELIYPVCDKAVNLARLSGKKTFTAESIAIIKDLGYTVNVEQKSL
jgi:hypothetical protein